MTTSPYYSFDRHASFSRALSLLLLVFVLYGTTVEAAHRHGNVFDADISGSFTAVSQPNEPSTVNGGQFGCNECVLCQLHKDFSAALVTVRAAGSPLPARLELLQPERVALKSQTNAPQKGRAPPFTS